MQGTACATVHSRLAEPLVSELVFKSPRELCLDTLVQNPNGLSRLSMWGGMATQSGDNQHGERGAAQRAACSNCGHWLLRGQIEMANNLDTIESRFTSQEGIREWEREKTRMNHSVLI